MSFDTAVAVSTGVLSALPVTVHLEMSTALLVLGLVALWIWRGRR